tara:strand:+ start:143 stop:763 length:621 start_codon:yes stop_codon:yes gene_type:complete
MSFLRSENSATGNKTNNLSREGKAAVSLPASYADSECRVVLEPVAKPIGTNLYKREQHKQQQAVIAKLKEEAPSLFQHQSVICKEENDERLYKQKAQYDTKISVESLAEVLEDNELCLRASFARPGFNSHNSSFMITAQNLRDMVLSEANEHNLKQQKFYVANDEANAAQSGYALFAVQPSKQEHVPYSLDYHALAKVDDKLFSEH